MVLFLLNSVASFRHKDDRRIRGAEDDASSIATTMDVMSLGSSEQEQEIQLVDSDEEGEQNGQYIHKAVYSNIFV